MFLLERVRTAGDIILISAKGANAPLFLPIKKRPEGRLSFVLRRSELEGSFDQATKAV